MLANMFYAEDFKEGRDITGNISPIIAGPTNMFAVSNYPTNYSFSLIILLSDFKIEEIEKLSVVFKNKETGEVLQKLVNLELPNVKGEIRNLNFNLEFRNLNIPSEGLYVSSLYVNEKIVSEAKLLFKIQ